MNEETSPSADFIDRKIGLVIFGTLTLFAGVICLRGALIFIRALLTPGMPDTQQKYFSAMIWYLLVACVLIWLGIGSIMARRWARALILILSWSLLILSLTGITLLLIMMPRLQAAVEQANLASHPESSASAHMDGLTVVLISVGIIFVIVPAVWVFFYGSKNTKATCEARDPVVRWTDRCPLPVLAVSLWLLWGIVDRPMSAAADHGLLPCFGIVITGIAGYSGNLLLGAAEAYSAWALYKLDKRGWWVLFITMSLVGISGFLTYSKHDGLEILRLSGYPEQKIGRVLNILKGINMGWVSICSAMPGLCYLLYVRKFFPQKP